MDFSKLKTIQKISEESGMSESFIKKAQNEVLTKGKHYFKFYGRILIDEGAFYEFIKESDGECLHKGADNLGQLLSQW